MNRGCCMWRAVAGLLAWSLPAAAQEVDLTRHTVHGGGAMFTAGGPLELSGTIGQPDAGRLAGGGFELSGGFWVAARACSDTEAPHIVHLQGLAGQTRPHSGYIDPRRESDNGGTVDYGVRTVAVVFSEPVFGLGGGPLDTADFEILRTGSGPAPKAGSVSSADNVVVHVDLSDLPPLQEWTTVVAHVQDACGNSILTAGDLGPGQVEPDRVDFAYLPGDIDQNGAVAPLDLLRFRQFISGLYHPPLGEPKDYFDTDRNGTIGPVDLLRYRQLLVGSGGAIQPWAGQALHSAQP